MENAKPAKLNRPPVAGSAKFNKPPAAGFSKVTIPPIEQTMGVDGVRSVVFLQDSVHIVSGSEDGTMRKWNRMGNPIGKPWQETGGSIHVVALSPDGKMIACGRKDGSVQRWDTDGKMEGAWRGHEDWVRSLSWSPSGNHIASGSDDGTILLRKAESGTVEVGPIKTNQERVFALAYSPSGDRIASGGSDFTICIWHTMTSQLVVGPIQGLGDKVTSVVWSSDSAKLYSASDKFARVFNSTSGNLLHHFEHNDTLYSIALSPQNNVLACVGRHGVAQLWDTESLQPLGQSFSREHENLYCVTFSPNGRYIACGSQHSKLTVRIVDIKASQQETRTDPQQETRPESPLSSCLDADATGDDGIIDEARDDPYMNFFAPSLPAATSSLPHSPNLSFTRFFWNTISLNHKPVSTEPTPLQERPKRNFLARLARSNSYSKPSTTTSDQSMPEGELRAREEAEQIAQDSGFVGALKPEKNEEDKREGSLTDVQSTKVLESEESLNIWRRFMGARGRDPTSVNIAPAMKRPEVVDVHAVRGFQRLVVMTPRRGKKSSAVTRGVPLTAIRTGNSSQPGQDPSSQAGAGQAGTLLQALSGQGGPPSTIHRTQYLQVVGSPSLHTSGPSHFVTTGFHTGSDSRSSLEGSCNRFLDKICYPCGHYH